MRMKLICMYQPFISHSKIALIDENNQTYFNIPNDVLEEQILAFIDEYKVDSVQIFCTSGNAFVSQIKAKIANQFPNITIQD